MCGIIGAVAERDIREVLLQGLHRLEYRGYDSAGLAVLDENGAVRRLRVSGKVSALEQRLETVQPPFAGQVGIAHTRWATHGAPSEANAHPHMSGDRIALVHNGIIENHETLRRQLHKEGYDFQSATDTEVIVNLIDQSMCRDDLDLAGAVRAALAELQGACAFSVISSLEPERLVAARLGSPLVLGLGEDGYYVASDMLAMLPVTRRFIVLEDGDVVVLDRTQMRVYSEAGEVQRPVWVSELDAEIIGKNGYRHYMLKEIHSQPTAVADTLRTAMHAGEISDAAFGPDAARVFGRVRRVQIAACGTSYHAGLIGCRWIEELAGLPCRVEVASEFRYQTPVAVDDTLFVAISQSGETADTLAALLHARKAGHLALLSVCNVPESALVRATDLTFITQAGAEIGVASTKAFTTQLIALLLLTLALARRNGSVRSSAQARQLELIARLPQLLQEVLRLEPAIQRMARTLEHARHALYLGRGILGPVAMEGALKLKEISYIHAEAYPAGELKHGPLALVDGKMPVIVPVARGHLVDKLAANLQEVHARGGCLLLFVQPGTGEWKHASEVLELPAADALLAPFLFTLPMQLLAYHVAVLRGADVDHPRNLAKSVTVE